MTNPQRKTNVVSEAVGDGLGVFDHQRKQPYVLNATSALVFQHCDGQTTLPQLTDLLRQKFNLPRREAEQLMWLALDELEKANLLQNKVTTTQAPNPMLTRRQVLTTFVAAGLSLALLPIVSPVSAVYAAPASPLTPNTTNDLPPTTTTTTEPATTTTTTEPPTTTTTTEPPTTTTTTEPPTTTTTTEPPTTTTTTEPPTTTTTTEPPTTTTAVINSSVVQESVSATYNATPLTCAATGTDLAMQTITPTFRNNSATTYTNLFFRVKTLEYIANQGGNQPNLCNATTLVNNGRAGSLLTVPNSSLPGSDSQFNPSDKLTLDFKVGLPVRAKYRFFIDLLASQVTAAGSGGTGDIYLGSFAYAFDENGQLVSGSNKFFLPFVQR